ncbi:hypothetical protein [Streptomyces sp. NPDC096132]
MLPLRPDPAGHWQILQRLRWNGEPVPCATGELLPVAKTDNGDMVYCV